MILSDITCLTISANFLSDSHKAFGPWTTRQPAKCEGKSWACSQSAMQDLIFTSLPEGNTAPSFITSRARGDTGFQQNKRPLAEKGSRDGGDRRDCRHRRCCFIIYFFPPHGCWCHKHFKPALFSGHFSVYSCESPRVAAHQGGTCEMRQSPLSYVVLWMMVFLTRIEAVNKPGSSEQGSFFGWELKQSFNVFKDQATFFRHRLRTTCS